MAFEISGTNVPNKTAYKWGLLKNNMKITARLQPKVIAKPCSFSPIKGLTRIEVCDQITDKSTGRVWCYCRVNGLYGFILYTSIRDYLRTPGQSITKVAQWVINDDFDTGDVRKKALETLGYDYDAVQAKVTEMYTPKKEENVEASLTFLFRGIARPTKDIDGLQGDCWVIKTGKYALIGDTMISGGLDRIKAEIKGCSDVSLYFSHEHSDHMSKNANNLIKAGLIKRCYVPSASTISTATKYKDRYNTLIKDCKNNGVQVIELKQGSVFSIGDIKAKVLFQQLKASEDSINMHSLCTLFTIGTRTYLTCGDHHCGESESNFVYKKHVDIYKSSHHQLFTGDTLTFIKGISPDWIVGSGWQNYPTGVCTDAKTKRAQRNYQKVGNLLPGDLCGRVEFDFKDGMITVYGERNMTTKSITYKQDGKTQQKKVYVCGKTTFHKVKSMIPVNAEF